MQTFLIVSRNFRYLELNLEFYKTLDKSFNLYFIEFKGDGKYCSVFEKNNFKYIYISSYKQLIEFLRINKNTICLPNLSDRYYDWIIFAIFKFYNLKLVLTSQIADRGMQTSNKNNKFVLLFQKFLFIISLFLRKIELLPKYDILFLSSRNKTTELNKYNKFKKIMYVNSYHYDQVLDMKSKLSDEYIVFLDSNTPFHADQVKMGLELIDSTLYYEKLNRLFDIIEDYFNKKVIICAHPSYDEKNVKIHFKNRLVVKNKTLEYVAKAKIVLVHNSSSVNYAISMRKLIILLDSDSFNIAIKHTLNILYNELSLDKINFYEDDILKQLNSINSCIDFERYNGYIEKYLAHSIEDNNNSTEIIINELHKLEEY